MTLLLCIDPLTLLIYLFIAALAPVASVAVGVGFLSSLFRLIREMKGGRQ
ncbi:MAG TPA: hypothetical protein VM866_06865 [Pyrinomonadaceae bacterium]|jgi:hypothetical protein|nr:hypothetical protein [Pyrinomonadaceae bacterium]